MFRECHGHEQAKERGSPLQRLIEGERAATPMGVWRNGAAGEGKQEHHVALREGRMRWGNGIKSLNHLRIQVDQIEAAVRPCLQKHANVNSRRHLKGGDEVPGFVRINTI